MADDAAPEVESAPAAPPPSAHDQYDLTDSAYDPSLDGPVELESPAPPAEAAPERPRDAAGKFLPSKPAQTHPKALLTLAADLRIPQEEIDGLSPEQLDLAVTHAYRQREVLRAEYARDRAQWERQYGAAPKAQEQPKEPEFQFDFGVDDDGKPLKEADFHKGFLSPLKQLAKEITDLKAQLAEAQARERARSDEEGFSQLDSGFADLGADYERVFGKGRGNAMRAADPALLLRISVVNSLRANPIPGLPVREAVAKRAQEMFGHLIGHTPAAPAVAQDAPRKPWATPTARPTSRTRDALPKGDQAAYRAARDWVKDHPEYAEDDGGTEEAALLNGIPE